MRTTVAGILVAASIAACGGSGGQGSGSGAVPPPASPPDAGPGSAPDAGPGSTSDAGPVGGSPDAGPVGGTPDAGTGEQSGYQVIDLGNAVPNSIDSQGRIAGSLCDDTSCAGATFTASAGWIRAPGPEGALWVVAMGTVASGRV